MCKKKMKYRPIAVPVSRSETCVMENRETIKRLSAGLGASGLLGGGVDWGSGMASGEDGQDSNGRSSSHS